MIVSSLRPALPTRDEAVTADAVERLADIPGLLGYYLCDEPTPARPGQTPDVMRWLFELC